ncbi:MAG: isoprenyl transferase [Alphaproteobacteria bacterium]|nr:isoprenyl transferase [Alphaproteobacteria bacterium]
MPHSFNKTPNHVAIIMDGNGRWATGKGLPREIGHKKGAESIREVMSACQDAGIKYLTIYAFSSENWQRSDHEVKKLMDLLRYYLTHELASLKKNGVSLHIIGDVAVLPDDIQHLIAKAELETSHNSKSVLNIALSYGSRHEIINACKSIAFQVSTGLMDPNTVNEVLFSRYLYTANIPDPDLLIRTGGEVRLSNFLLWQCAYTELYFTDTLWPDFNKDHFLKALADYAARERKFGK